MFSPNNWVTDEYDGMSVNASYSPVSTTGGTGFVHTSATYDPIGHPLTATDAQGFVTQSAYDYWNRPLSVTDPLSHTTVRTYYAPHEASIATAGSSNPKDCTGLLKQVQSPGPDAVNFPTVTTQYTDYDLMGRLLRTDAPYNGTPSNLSGNALTNIFDSAFNMAGDLTSQDDGAQASASGVHVTGYQYDQLGRKALCTYPDNTFEKWAYDASGNLKTYVNRAGTACTYQYDYYPNGNYPCFAYDNQDRCTGMYSGNTTFSYYYYPANWLKGRWLANGLYTSYGYQNNGRVNEVWHYHGDINGNQVANGSISRRGYGYAPDGPISWFDREADSGQSGSALENERGDVYDYWPDGSLHFGARDVACTGGWPGIFSPTADSRVSDSNASYANPSVNTYGFTYQYDAAGNRSQVSQLNQPTATYTADGENRSTSPAFAYDANGNATSAAVNWTYSYDAENKLLSAANSTTGQSIQNALIMKPPQEFPSLRRVRHLHTAPCSFTS